MGTLPVLLINSQCYLHTTVNSTHHLLNAEVFFPTLGSKTTVLYFFFFCDCYCTAGCLRGKKHVNATGTRKVMIYSLSIVHTSAVRFSSRETNNLRFLRKRHARRAVLSSDGKRRSVSCRCAFKRGKAKWVCVNASREVV